MGPLTPSLSDIVAVFVSGEISVDDAGGAAPAVFETVFMKRRFGETQRNSAFCGRERMVFFCYFVSCVR